MALDSALVRNLRDRRPWKVKKAEAVPEVRKNRNSRLDQFFCRSNTGFAKPNSIAAYAKQRAKKYARYFAN